MGLKDYLRWLGQLLSKFPRGLKNVVTGTPKFLGRPIIEAYVGWFGIAYGIVAIVGSTYWNIWRDYELFGKYYFIGLTNTQWSLITLVGFFLLTHGLYRMDKEAEA